MKLKRVVLGIGLLVVACTRPETPTGEEYQDVPADMVMIGMTEYMTSGGLRQAQLKGDTAYVYDDSGKVAIKGVNLLIYNELGAQSAKLTSKTGDFNTTNQGMIARGKVVLITNERNLRIETEELFYDPESHRVWSNVPTVIIEAGRRSNAAGGFESDDKFANVKVRGLTGRVGGVKF